MVSIFGCHQEVFDGLASSEVDLYGIQVYSDGLLFDGLASSEVDLYGIQVYFRVDLYAIQVYLREGKTIKDLLVAPKDRDHITKKSMVYKSTSEGARPSKTSWWHPKIDIISPRRVASYIGISVTGWNVMKSI